MPNIREITKEFSKILERDALGHSYIFFGNEKEAFTLAATLARKIETGKEAGDGPLLDTKIVKGAEEDLGIESARAITHFLSLAPFQGSRRTLIITRADQLTNQAQNALLKTAEEPPLHSLLILILADPGALRPALRSRFQKIYVSGGRNYERPLTEEEQEAEQLARTFLRSGDRERSALLKQLIEGDREVVKGEKIIDNFLKFLIQELAKDPVKHSAALTELLYRYELMQQHPLNKRLQIEAITKFL